MGNYKSIIDVPGFVPHTLYETDFQKLKKSMEIYEKLRTVSYSIKLIIINNTKLDIYLKSAVCEWGYFFSDYNLAFSNGRLEPGHCGGIIASKKVILPEGTEGRITLGITTNNGNRAQVQLYFDNPCRGPH